MNEPNPNDQNTLSNPRGPDRAVPKPLKKGRLWLFRLLSLFLVPACILGALELALSVSGYGYPTSYFLKSRVNDQDFLIPNYKFSYRFFPRAMARVPTLYRIPAQKSPGVYRIFVFGESAALGDPDPNYGIARYLDALLEERYPDAEFEVVCVAMTAINSHVILPIARECARLDGDLWLIYMGNNEMVGPFGAGTIFGARAPGLGFVRTSLALKTTRLGRLMANLTSKPGSTSRVPDKWEGINMFKKNLLRHDDPKRARAYENFEGNLKDILEVGRQAGVPIILSTVGSNLKDCSPFASLHREDLKAAEKSEWDRLFQEGLALEKTEQYEKALSHYQDAAAIDSEFAELQFRVGTCQLALGRSEQARQAFALARDYDALAVRADTRINQILMDSIAEGDDREFGVDAAEALSAQSPEGISGKEFFYEHVHCTVEGNFTLARIIADQVSAALPAEISATRTENWSDRETCDQRLALTVWDQMRLWQEESQRINTLPFTSQTSNSSNKNHVNARRNRIRAGITKNTGAWDRQMYESALERAPEDTFLIANYAQFLDATGKSAEAIEQAERFRALLPDIAWTHYYLAALLAKSGRFEEARESLETALEIRGDFTQALEALESIKGR